MDAAIGEPECTLPYAIGALDWIIAYDNVLPKLPDEKAQAIEEGLRHLEIALALSPDYDDAMT